MDKGDTDTIKSLLNMAYIHYDCHEYDAAAEYARRILQYANADSTYAIPVSVYNLLAKIAENKNNYREALEYTNKYHALLEEMREKQEEQSLAGIKERYELELAQIEKQEAGIRTPNKLLVAGLVMAVLIIMILVFVFGYIRYKKRFMKAKEANNRHYRQQIDSIKKVALTDYAKTTPKDEMPMNGNNTWDALYAVLTEWHGGAIQRIQQQMALPEQDFQICCYAYAGFSDKEMAVCLHLSPNTIKSRKNHIRKQLNVAERGSIKKLMTQKLQEKVEKTLRSRTKSIMLYCKKVVQRYVG
jgi:DNA-binding CsgD family transcriptional regulator